MTTVCAECREQVSPGRSKCPHCGYDPGSVAVKSAWSDALVGALLSLTGIGALVGVPLLVRGRRKLVYAERVSPATEVDDER